MLKGSDTIFHRIFFVSQNRKTLHGNPSVLCFRKILAAKKLLDKKGEYQYYPSKIFCLTVPKKFVGEPFSVSLISGIEKVYASDGYVTIFRRSFCHAVPKNLAGEPFSAVFQKFSGSEKV